MAPDKVRVAISDATEALRAVHADVEGAIGCAVFPELQETEGGSLIVEMRLAERVAQDCRELARTIKRSNPDIEVLSCWKDRRLLELSGIVSLHSVLPASADELPAVARRALQDGVPTAQWSGSRFVRPTGRTSAWLLAVPVQSPTGGNVVGLSRRNGYSYRFGAAHVEAIRSELAS